VQAIGLGLIAFLVSGWAIWITDLHFELLFPFDRFTLITMLGTSMLVAGLAGLIETRFPLGSLLVALLVGLSVGIQFQHRLEYRQEWLSQKNFFWQLAWRAPDIRPGTMVITSEIPFQYFSDNSLTAPLNWMYAPDNTSRRMEYLMFDIEARLDENMPEILPEIPIHMEYRAANFDGSTSKAIVLFYDPPRCLKIMNPETDRFLPVKPLYIREATSLSRLDLIDPASESVAEPPLHIFGTEPDHQWCYYFEKAELYGQQRDWESAAQMADQALKINKHFTDKNVSELIPFVMAYAHTGRWKRAVELTNAAFEIWDKTQYPLCDAWQSILQNTPESEPKTEALAQAQKILSCSLKIE
jgi:tetratricopeptide (TPR) repeat protein